MNALASPTPRGAARARWITVALHGALVAFLMVVVLAGLATYQPGDNNLGAGLSALALMALGVPWTLLAWDTPAWGSTEVVMLIVFASALLNVGLHAALIEGLYRLFRRRPRPS